MLKNISIGVGLFCAGVAFAHPALAQPAQTNSPGQTEPVDVLTKNPEVHITYYDVSGSNADEIRRSINDSPSRPTDYDGERMDGETKTNFKWSWWNLGNGVCDPSRAQVTLKAEVILPRLVEKVSSDLTRRWNAYMANLRTHEAGHVLIAKMRFGDVLAAARSTNCSGINSTINAIITQIQQTNVEYDKVTKHGETQGAKFPWGH